MEVRENERRIHLWFQQASYSNDFPESSDQFLNILNKMTYNLQTPLSDTLPEMILG